MYRILVVDDSYVDRRLIGGLLTRRGDYDIRYANDGREALSVIESHAPDLVITDLVMPEMDGLELVRLVRAGHPHVPVILMTAYGNESTAAEALELGAASYVPKASQAERLVETVERVLARAKAARSQEQLMGCLAEIQCTFQLENDPALIPALVDLFEQTLVGIPLSDATGRVRLGVALEEALLNALYHGNLELGERQLAEARSELTHEQFTAMIEDRRQQPPYCDRKIHVEANISPFGARFVIRDGGPGFRQVIESEEALPFENGRNRGLRLMRTLMDEVTYNETGNEVVLFKRRDSIAARMTRS
jgi:CheY-like chemotaxis protein/anti-sigma regulatory factor (Ser/Thr protein kinase)